MIEGKCVCGNPFSEPESVINQAIACRKCNAMLTAVSAESLAEGGGAGDFDAVLLVASGPSRVGEQFFLGGVPEIQIGKLPDRQIQLTGTQVSRSHAKLSRVDFGPSRWNIVDNKSTNGVFINGQRVASQELQTGDRITIGEFELAFTSQYEEAAPEVFANPTASAPAAVAQMTMPPMTSTGRPLTYAAPHTDVRTLGESDPAWVKKLKQAANLLLWGVIANFVSGIASRSAGEEMGMIVGVLGALLNLAGAWLLTEGEPGAIETSGRALLRIALRITSTMTAAGGLSAAGAQLLHIPLLALGGLLAIAAIPQFFLFLFFLRQLAQRIPDDGLASQCMIVMIGLPASVSILVASILFGVATHSAASGLFGVCFSIIGLVVFAIWYIVILIKFQKSIAFA